MAFSFGALAVWAAAIVYFRPSPAVAAGGVLALVAGAGLLAVATALGDSTGRRMDAGTKGMGSAPHSIEGSSSQAAAAETSFQYWQGLARLTVEPNGPVLRGLLFRLLVEVEALRAAQADPSLPEPQRARYAAAYARTAVLVHDDSGPAGGLEKLLSLYFPREQRDRRLGDGECFFAERMMMARLGANADEIEALSRKLAEVEMNT